MTRHIESQRAMIEAHIAQAVAAGGDRGELDHRLEQMVGVMSGLHLQGGMALQLPGESIFPAFLPGDDQETRIGMAQAAFRMARPLIGVMADTLESEFGEFIRLREAHPDVAFHFGLALVRLHPATTEQVAEHL